MCNVGVALLLAMVFQGCGTELRLPLCGNGVVEGREECDDGNLLPGDGCDEYCRLEAREICDNGVDDTGNGSADCADPACFGHPACTGSEICNNGFDDDGDGLVDCDDPDCAGSIHCQRPEICDNGVDDDGDGFTDCDDRDCFGHPACGGCDAELSFGELAPGMTRSVVVDTEEAQGLGAPSCAGGPPALHLRFTVTVATGFHLRLSAAPLTGLLVVALVKEDQPEVTCGMTELLCRVVGETPVFVERSALPPGTYRVALAGADPGTTGRIQIGLTLVAGTVEICDNGVDDTGNGLVDCADPQCHGAPGCLVEICDNGVDDTGNGLVDCEDPQCATAPVCLPPEICGSGLDEDGDGLVDCADPDCAGTAGCIGSDCVINADLGRLGRGSRVSHPFDTRMASHDNHASCGGAGPDVVAALTLDATANLRVRLVQSGDHVLAFGGEGGPGSWCDDAEYRCVDPGASGRSGGFTLHRLPPARYFLWVDAKSAQSTGSGTAIVEVHDPALELCDNGVDDNGDGLVDCDDPLCGAAQECLPETACHDGVDNDQDGWVDCADFDCVGTPACGPGACQPERHLGSLVPTLPALVTVSTAGVQDRFSTSCAGAGGGGDVVLSLDVPIQGTLVLQAQQSGFSDHVVALMCLGGPGSACDAAEHWCVDGGAPGLPISTAIPGVPPGRYYLLVEPFGPGGAGVLSLQVTLVP